MYRIFFAGRVVVAGGLLVLTAGCATRGELQRGLEEQRAALAAERAERLAADQQLGSQLEQQARRVEAFRTQLASMDSEFGTRLTSLEEGMQLAAPVHFAFDRAEVNAEASALLDRFAQIIRQNYPEAIITVEGFADPAGSAAYNRRLSQKRAEAVREELIRRGVLAGQVRAVGYGSERPVVPGAAGSATGAELNRRVVFAIETGAQAVAATPAVIGVPTASR
jgi:peptidoglycan-associated lipoprotein